jgi:hypothetical protein
MSIAIWTVEEENALLDFLVENRAAVGDGGNFKVQTFRLALDSVTPLHKEGAPKVTKMLQTKWKGVSMFFLHHYHDI